MDKQEICTSFRMAKNKQNQITVLAQLTDSDVETIDEILFDHGLYIREDRCTRCGRIFQRCGKPYCRDCETRLFRSKAEKDARKKWIRYQIRENEARKMSLMRQIALLDQENQRLKEGMT